MYSGVRAIGRASKTVVTEKFCKGDHPLKEWHLDTVMKKGIKALDKNFKTSGIFFVSDIYVIYAIYGHLKLTVCLINFYIVRFKFCSSYKGLTSVHIHLMASGGYFGPSGGSRGLCWCRSLESHWWCHCNRKFWQVSLSSFHDASKKGTDFKNKCTCKDHHTTMLHKKEEEHHDNFRQAFLWHIHGHQAPDRVGVTVSFQFFLIIEMIVTFHHM